MNRPGRIGLILTVLLTFAGALSSVACQKTYITGDHAESIITGDHAESIEFGGQERTYLIHIPTSLDHSKRVPLVFVLHGGGGTGDGMKRLTLNRFDTLADAEGFIVVYPDGFEKSWNDGREGGEFGAHIEKIDDVGFFSTLIDHFIKELNVDPKRVYFTGISNGALMSHRLACELSSKIAAIAPLCGSKPAGLPCTPSRPVSVLAINGTADPLAPWQGGWVAGKKLSVPESIQFWVAHNQCSPIPITTQLPDTDPTDGTRIHLETYSNGQEDTEVILCVVEGGGHTWPGGVQYLPESTIGKTSRDINACDLIWDFFKRHSR